MVKNTFNFAMLSLPQSQNELIFTIGKRLFVEMVNGDTPQKVQNLDIFLCLCGYLYKKLLQ